MNKKETKSLAKSKVRASRWTSKSNSRGICPGKSQGIQKESEKREKRKRGLPNKDSPQKNKVV